MNVKLEEHIKIHTMLIESIMTLPKQATNNESTVVSRKDVERQENEVSPRDQVDVLK